MGNLWDHILARSQVREVWLDVEVWFEMKVPELEVAADGEDRMGDLHPRVLVMSRHLGLRSLHGEGGYP
jgi:hypothetical protein